MTGKEQRQVRNATIDEMCDWLMSCVQHVDQETEVYKACFSMVTAMRKKKAVDPAPDTADTSYPDETHYPIKK
jgi:hypothetical protein